MDINDIMQQRNEQRDRADRLEDLLGKLVEILMPGKSCIPSTEIGAEMLLQAARSSVSGSTHLLTKLQAVIYVGPNSMALNFFPNHGHPGQKTIQEIHRDAELLAMSAKPGEYVHVAAIYRSFSKPVQEPS